MNPTPQSASHPGSGNCVHLTEAQLDELLARPTGCSDSDAALVEAHLLTCEQCAAELDSLRESLFLFRQANTAYADRQLRLLPRWSLPARPYAMQPAYFGAAAILLVSLVPMQMLHRRSLLSHPAVVAGVSAGSADHDQAESDDALLEDVSSEVSASVPVPMQALDNPTAITENDSQSLQTSNQRKD